MRVTDHVFRAGLAALLILTPASLALAESREVIVGVDGKMTATIISPSGTGPYPGVLLLHTSGGTEDDWRLWLTAAGLSPRISKHPGVTFDLSFMTVQAAIDGIGVAIGRTSYVEADIAKGRLVVPFKVTLPADAGFYLVSPEARSDPPKLAAFRQWLAGSVQTKV